MAISVHLVNLVHWRWASSVGLVLVACLPIAAAALFIPSAIDAPWGARASSMLPRSVEKRAPDSEPEVAHAGANTMPVLAAPVTAPARRHSTRMPTSPHKVAQAHTESDARARGYFVPTGESDDARALEPRQGTRR